METIKSYTDLEQSKKLAEILPLESADGFYEAQHNPITNEWEDILFTGTKWASKDVVIPAWSLAALLELIPKIYYPVKDHPTYLILGKPKDKWCALYWDATGMQDGEQTLEDNPIDACYEMIIKLHELNLL